MFPSIMAIKLDPFDFVIQVCEEHDELANENAKTCPYCVIRDLREEIEYLKGTDEIKH